MVCTESYIVTASADCLLKVLRKVRPQVSISTHLLTQEDLICQQTLYGHTFAITSVDVCCVNVKQECSFGGQVLNETFVASGSVDQTVRVWNMATGVNIHTLEGHTGTRLPGLDANGS